MNLATFAGCVLLLVTPVCSADEVFPVVHKEPIAVRVVDSKTGHPLPNVHLILTAGYSSRDLSLGLWREEAVTAADGSVLVSGALRNLPVLRVEALKRRLCTPGPTAWSVERIRVTGLSAPNRCSDLAPIASPGTLILVAKTGKKASKKGQKGAIFEPNFASRLCSKSPVPPLSDAEIDQVLAEEN